MERLICKGSSNSAFYSLMTGVASDTAPSIWISREGKRPGGWGGSILRSHNLRFCFFFLCLVNQKALRVCGIHANCEIPGRGLRWGLPDSSDYRDFFPHGISKRKSTFQNILWKTWFLNLLSLILSKWYLKCLLRVWDMEETELMIKHYYFTCNPCYV